MKRSTGTVAFIITIVVTLATVFITIFGIGGRGKASNITLGLDLRGGVSVTYQVEDEEFTQEQLDDTIYKLQLRVAEYSTDASVYQEGTNRITVEIPGVYDTETVIEELGRPGSLQFATEYEAVTDEETGETGYYATEDGLVLTGSSVKEAKAGSTSDQTTGQLDYIVQLTLDEEGTEAFATATSENIGNVIYILYDGAIVSSPTVKSAITGGECEISGMGSYDAASTLASTIRIGSLSLELKEMTSKVVSAKLGENAVSTSLLAGMIGILVIIIFLILTYKISGVAASIAMIFYSGAILLLMNAFDITLTISGIAGIILSIGMAVDGNVIINTRIKEELEEGISVESAIRNGFKKSTASILDGNITTLIVAIVLLIFGSGTIQGFGLTLAIGIVLSVFTSLVVSRIIVTAFYAMGLKAGTFYARVKNGKKKIFDFVGKRLIWFVIAIACILSGVIALIVNAASGKQALNLSIEFVGGVSTQVEFEKDYSIDEFNDDIRPAIQSLLGTSDVEGQKINGTNQFVIKTPTLEQEQITDLKELLINDYAAVESGFEITSIAGVISNELQRDAFISLAIAAVCMLIYIWIRFRKFKFAISSVIALLHDVSIVIAFYALFRISAGNTFIACILTIVGYSINATIVIFDRIRENLADPELGYDLKLAINTSIYQSMTRSIYTSATTFVMVLFLYIFGVESMRAFAMPLGVGIVAGAFSSVLISGSLVYMMTKKEDRYDAKAAAIAAKSITKTADNEKMGSDDAMEIEAGSSEAENAAPSKIKANPNHKKKHRKQ